MDSCGISLASSGDRNWLAAFQQGEDDCGDADHGNNSCDIRTALDIPPIFFSSIILSALAGVVLGDFFLFAALRRIRPRRSNILFASNAIFAALLGWVYLGEVIGLQTGLAIVFGVGGVVLAVIYGKRRDLLHQWEDVTPPLWIGVVFGLMAAICQAFGVVFVRPVMAAGVYPVAVTLVQAAVGTIVFWTTFPSTQAARAKRYSRVAGFWRSPH